MNKQLRIEIEQLIKKNNLNCSIKEFKDSVNWSEISWNQKLSENFIREFKDNVYWPGISWNQKLSEIFIREFKDNVYWSRISKYQKLSEVFIREFKDNVYWTRISNSQKLSENFIREFKLSVNKETNWLYWTFQQKLAYIKNNCVPYELVDDKYIIAYKSTKLDGYSCYNFQYKYEVGNTYDSHCDCNVDEQNSFGLSAWTKEKALDYNSKGELYKVKINIEDIGCFIHKDTKIRCHKLEIIQKM